MEALKLYTLEQIANQVGTEVFLLNYFYRQFSQFFSPSEYAFLSSRSFSKKDLEVFKTMIQLYQNDQLSEQSLQQKLNTTDRTSAQKTKEEFSKIVSFASGKGGVGKTICASFMAFSIAKKGLKTLLFDADLGLSNAYIHLGGTPQAHLGHFLHEKGNLDDIICSTQLGVDLISSGNGVATFSQSSTPFHTNINFLFQELKKRYDAIVIDIGAGINEDAMHFASFAQTLFLVTIPDISSLTDAYGFFKIFTQQQSLTNIHLIVNRCRGKEDGEFIHKKISSCTNRFLNKNIEKYTWLPLVSKTNYFNTETTPQILEKHRFFSKNFKPLLNYFQKSTKLKPQKVRLGIQ